MAELSLYLQNEQKRLNESISSSQREGVKAAYDKEMKILIKEENILYNLVEYLQDVGFLKTDKKIHHV